MIHEQEKRYREHFMHSFALYQNIKTVITTEKYTVAKTKRNILSQLLIIDEQKVVYNIL